MPNLINVLPSWSGDCAEQTLFIDALKQQLQSALIASETHQVTPVFLSQATEPSQAQWETAYPAQTGRSLPILPSTQLLWWNSTTNSFGGLYGTTPLNNTVYSRAPRYTKGTHIFQESKVPSGATISASTPIGVNAFSETISVSLNQRFNLELIHNVFLNVTVAGTIGGDFLINGIKAGTSYFGVQNNRSLFESQQSQLYATRIFLENMPAGAYTFQNIFGYTGSPVTAPAATKAGIGQFTVKAYGL